MAAKREHAVEFKQRAVRLVLQDPGRGAIGRVAEQLGIHTETLRKWVRRAQVDAGERSGVTSEQLEEIRRLRRENAELRRANEILRDAAAFFAGELDPRRRR